MQPRRGPVDGGSSRWTQKQSRGCDAANESGRTSRSDRSASHGDGSLKNTAESLGARIYFGTMQPAICWQNIRTLEKSHVGSGTARMCFYSTITSWFRQRIADGSG